MGGGALSRKAGREGEEGVFFENWQERGCRVQGRRRSEEARLPGRGRSGAGRAPGTSELWYLPGC